MKPQQQYIKSALSMLGIEKLVLAIHDQSFPSLPEEEIGRGSPYSVGGRAFVEFVADLGFTGIQLGPQGRTSLSNPSPYDSSLFSRNELSISLLSLARQYQEKLIPEQEVQRIADGSPSKNGRRSYSSYTYAWKKQHEALATAWANFCSRKKEFKELALAMANFNQEQKYWLEPELLYEALALDNGTDDWRRWSEWQRALGADPHKVEHPRCAEIRSKHATDVEAFEFQQFLAQSQHQEFHKYASACGIKLFADFQIGISLRDRWAWQDLFLKDYLLGAPPSRTNPDGQPWGYPVLDPDLYKVQAGSTLLGQALLWLLSRLDKLLLDFDGMRIDHPHGIVCPWVYKASDSDALHAVQNGARLFESPAVPDHPELASYAIVRQDQLADPKLVPRYADDWVTNLDEPQVNRYATIIQLIHGKFGLAGVSMDNVACEVLSSCPYPLKRVLEAWSPGRFRVTQKCQLSDPTDAYRTDQAKPSDWVMPSTHDTPPIRLVVSKWNAEQRQAWAEYLSTRLCPKDSRQEEMKTALAANERALTEALFADLFIGPAGNVSVFFADLLGIDEIYNKPGIIDEANWMVSVPNDYESAYKKRLHEGAALNLPRVLSMALRARYGSGNAQANDLITQLMTIAADA